MISDKASENIWVFKKEKQTKAFFARLAFWRDEKKIGQTVTRAKAQRTPRRVREKKCQEHAQGLLPRRHRA